MEHAEPGDLSVVVSNETRSTNSLDGSSTLRHINSTNTTDLQKSYAACRNIALGHYENFPVGSALLPKRIRPDFFALYAFMRTADDIADLPGINENDRLSRLAAWRQDLDRITSNAEPSNSLFLALRETIKSRALDAKLLYALLEAFEFDAKAEVRFNTFENLRWYTARSADPVGRLVLALFGFTDSQRLKWSDDICTALQLLNFIQDAKEDLMERRHYFPREDFQNVGINSAEEIVNSRFAKDLMLLECGRVEELLKRGAPLVDSVSGRLKLELRAVMGGASVMVRKIRAAKGDVISSRPKLSRREQRRILIASLFGWAV